jgi:LmbE family N-acetylglucosaminyl deacetylase
LHEDISSSLKFLDVEKVIKGKFSNIKFNAMPHLRLIKFIEKAINETEADVVFTHHPCDLNNDHLHTSFACQAAARFFQKQLNAQMLCL